MFGVRRKIRRDEPVYVPQLEFFEPSKHLQAMMRIARDVYSYPWPRRRWLRLLRQDDVVAIVAKLAGVVVAYAVWRETSRESIVEDLVVDPKHHRRGLGRLLIRQIQEAAMCSGIRVKKVVGESGRIRMVVSESNLAAQLFLRSVGFRTTKILRRHGDDGEDCYRFVWKGTTHGRR